MGETTLVLASRWKRLFGALVDALIAMAITFPVMFVTGVFGRIRQGQGMSIGQHIFFLILGLAVFLAVNGYLLAKSGQTVGKRLIGTRIVGYTDERILPLAKVFCLRYLPITLIAQIPFIGGLFSLVDVLFIFRGDKRCIHDLIAGTKVVDA